MATAQAEEAPSGNASGGAWRVECSGDGKTLDCRAVQQLVTREDGRTVVVVAARIDPATKAPVLGFQLPLGVNLSEPMSFRIDNGREEKISIQTCTQTGCFLSLPIKEPLMASLRTGKKLKIAIQDPDKRKLDIDVPLLGFGLAFDKATK